MTSKGKYERLITCSVCEGNGASWDVHLRDFTIDCPNCAGEGTVCGECLNDVLTCNGEGVCWERDLNDYFDPEED